MGRAAGFARTLGETDWRWFVELRPEARDRAHRSNSLTEAAPTCRRGLPGAANGAGHL